MFRGIAIIVLMTTTTAFAQASAPEIDPVAAEAQDLLDDIQHSRKKYDELSKRREKLEGEERAVVVVQMRKRLLDTMANLDELVGKVLALEERGIEAGEFRKSATAFLSVLNAGYPEYFDSLGKELSELREELGSADEASKGKLAERIHTMEDLADAVFRLYLEHLGHLASFGLPSDGPRADLAKRIAARAETLAGRLERSSERLQGATRNAEASGDAALVGVARAELDAVAGSLATSCDVMEGLELETAVYRQLMIQATGEITGDVLDTKVAAGLLDQALESLRASVREFGPTLVVRVLFFFAILGLSWIAAAVTRRAVRRLVQRYESSMSELARRMIVSTASRVVMIVGFFIALSQIGIEVTALLAGLGIVGFIVGFALQDSLGNFASGAMILMYRPFDVGDTIRVGGVLGTVSDMTLVSTTIMTPDNQTLVVPNTKIWGDVIQNITAQKIRRVDLQFGVSHAAGVEQAERVFSSILREHPKVLEEPEPAVKVHEITGPSVEYAVRPWVNTDDYWDVYWDVTREAKIRLDREGIRSATYRHDVEIVRDGSPASAIGGAPDGPDSSK